MRDIAYFLTGCCGNKNQHLDFMNDIFHPLIQDIFELIINNWPVLEWGWEEPNVRKFSCSESGQWSRCNDGFELPKYHVRFFKHSQLTYYIIPSKGMITFNTIN